MPPPLPPGFVIQQPPAGFVVQPPDVIHGPPREAPLHTTQTPTEQAIDQVRLDQMRNPVPAGYRRTADGNLEFVPGGPADPANRTRSTRQLPQPAAQTLESATTGVMSLSRAIGGFRDDFAGNAITGGIENSIQNRFSGFGTPGQSQWWSDVAATDNILRNALFGASLTEGEKAAWEATTVTPSMAPDLVRTNLQRRLEIAQGLLRRRARTYRANGFNEDAIRESLGELQTVLDDGQQQQAPPGGYGADDVRASVASAAANATPAAPVASGPSGMPPPDDGGLVVDVTGGHLPTSEAEGGPEWSAAYQQARAQNPNLTFQQFAFNTRAHGSGQAEAPQGDTADRLISASMLAGNPGLAIPQLIATTGIAAPGDMTDAATRGVQDIQSFGTRDELAGGARTLAAGGTRDANIARERGFDARDWAEHPISRGAGEFLGGFALPFNAEASLGRNMLATGAQGGAYGFGSGEGNFLQRAPNAAVGATIGALAPVALRGTGKALNALFGSGEGAAERQALIGAADRQDVPIMPADVGGPIIRRLTAGGAQLPFASGPILRAAARTEEAAMAARDRIAGTVGEVVDTELAGETARRGAKSFIERTSGRGNQLYTRAERLAGDTRIEPTNARQVLDQNIAELAETPGGAAGLSTLQALREQLNGAFTVSGIRRMRTALRDQFISNGLRGSDLERRVGQVVDAAADDVVAGLTSNGRQGAARAYQQADRYWRDRLRTIDTVLEPIIGKNGERSAEEIVAAIQRSARGNTQRLSDFIAALPAEESATVRATLIGQLGRPTAGADAGRAFSLNRFLTHWNQMTPRSRTALFGEEARDALNDLATIAQGTRQAQGYANRSNTGGAVSTSDLVRGLSIYSAWGSAGASAIVENLGARLLASPAFARWLAGAARTRNPRLFAQGLSTVAARNPAIAQEVLGLRHALLNAANDNLHQAGRVAASPDQGPNNANQ